MKRNLINSSLITKKRRLGRRGERSAKIPRLRAKAAKKTVQRKVVTCKKLLMAHRPKRGRKAHRRSKSAAVESRWSTEADLKLKITSTIQDCLDREPRKPSCIVRFHEVERQFGEVIERIKNLKFASPQ